MIEVDLRDVDMGVRGNPGTAHWKTLGDLRKSLEPLKKNVGDIEFFRVSISRTRNKKTGEVVESVEGGPYIMFKEPWVAVTKKGVGRPVTRARLFTWTTKMSSPSFSLPAGPTKEKGTCPASLQKTVEAEGSYQDEHEPIPPGAAYICNFCYAGKNNYLQYKQVTVNQLVHLWWADREVERGRFSAKMTEAIAALAFDDQVDAILRRKDVSAKYFRIHDAGDFHTPSYYRAWVDVCRNLPEVKFWAPTRQWVFEKWRRLMENYPPPANLALRPSALFLGATPPNIQGLSGGTTSVEGRMEKPIWNCPAYEAEDETSCAAARCRVCWTSKAKPVNYLTH